MTNQQVVQALREHIQADQRLVELLQEKERLEKDIQYYQMEKEMPTPEHPSKFKIFMIDVAVCYGLGALLAETIPSLGTVLMLTLLILPCIIFPFHYKEADKDALGEYVAANFRYQQFMTDKEKKLPILNSQLQRVMIDGKQQYKNFQNTQLRTLLHPDYVPYASTLLGYFERGRVQNLTEAVNLLEVELREYQRDRQTAAYRNEMLHQASAQTEAAQASAEYNRQSAASNRAAAFWNAATYGEVAKIRRELEYR